MTHTSTFKSRSERANLLFQDGHDGFQNGIEYVEKDGVSCSNRAIVSFKSLNVFADKETLRGKNLKQTFVSHIPDEKVLLWIV